MLKVSKLSHHYPGKSGFSVTDISFEISEGEILGFLGPSGSGKSTVQNLMIGLLKLQHGEVTYDGSHVSDLRKSFYNQIGVSFEQPNLYPLLTAEENLRYFAGLYTVPTIAPAELLLQVGLLESRHKKVRAFSKGMKQRLVFARALLNQPKYLFLDEPTSGLDPYTAARICEIILAQKAAGKVIFLTTHNMALADRLCDRVAFLDQGKIFAMDSPDRLKIQYGNRLVDITYSKDGIKMQEILDLDKESQKLSELIKNHRIHTIHSGEASLEDIFIAITGRGLVS